MLKGPLLHPEIARALARAGHGSKVLVSDGNYPHATRRGPNAELVFLNLAPGTLGALDVLPVLTAAIPIEAAAVMAPPTGSPEPPIWRDFEAKLKLAGLSTSLARFERDAFYLAASGPDVCLTIATGEQAIYANLLLTIGVVT
jgi:L-fucose mutarotase